MRRFFKGFGKGVKTGGLALAGLLLVASAFAPEAAAQSRYFLQAVDDNDTGLGAVARCRVLTDGTKTNATVYTSRTLGTALGNPITTDADGQCSWWGATGTTYDVVMVVDSGSFKGGVAHVKSVTASAAHKVRIARGSALKVLMVPFSGTTAATVTATQTVPAGALVDRVLIETVVGGAAAAAMHVGNANIGVDGYCAAANVRVSGRFTFCDTTDPTAATEHLHGTTAVAVNYTTQGHTASGYLWLFYMPTAF